MKGFSKEAIPPLVQMAAVGRQPRTFGGRLHDPPAHEVGPRPVGMRPRVRLRRAHMRILALPSPLAVIEAQQMADLVHVRADPGEAVDIALIVTPARPPPSRSGSPLESNPWDRRLFVYPPADAAGRAGRIHATRIDVGHQLVTENVMKQNFRAGSKIATTYKDLGLAKELGVPMFVTGTVHELFQAGIAMNPDEDNHTIIKLMEQVAGVEVKGRS